MWKSVRVSLLATAMVAGLGLSASAQVMPSVIGATVGNMAANANSKGGCDHSFAKDPKYLARRGAELDKIMTKYANASVASVVTEEREARKIFSDLPEGGEFGADKLIHPGVTFSLSGDRPAQAPRLVRKTVALGGDMVDGRWYWVARGIWKVEPAGAASVGGGGVLYYAVDFRQEPIWSNWRVWRIRAFDNEADLPRTSEAFCNFASIGALW